MGSVRVSGEKIWLDGRMIDWDAARVHVLTHTLHYGLGVFEGIRCYRQDDGRSAVFRLPEHVRRLYESAHINLLEIPYSREQLTQRVPRDAARERAARGLPAPARVHRGRRDGAEPGGQPDPGGRDGVALGQVSGRGGHRARHPRDTLGELDAKQT